MLQIRKQWNVNFTFSRNRRVRSVDGADEYRRLRIKSSDISTKIVYFCPATHQRTKQLMTITKPDQKFLETKTV